MNKQEATTVQNYLKAKLGNRAIRFDAPRKDGSVEVLLGDEFIGTVYKDVEDGETTYHFTMSILDIDLDGFE